MLMGRDIVITYKRRQSSSKTLEPNSSAILTKESERYKKRQKLSSGCMKQKDSSCTESSTRLNSNSKLVAFCRRFVQNRNIPEPHASADHAVTSFLKLPEIASLTNSGKNVDGHMKFPHKTAENAPLAAVQLTKDSVKETFLIHGQRGAEASCNIDHNLPFECGSDKNNQTGTSKVHHSGGSCSKMKEKISTFAKKSTAVAVGDKCKGLARSSFLFAESTSNSDLPSIANEQGRNLVKPVTVRSSRPRGVYLHPEQTINSHTSHFSLCGWPDLQISLAAWSEEELDSLWIGIRRHGKGNWGAILRDPRMNFMPWRTPSDLAQRWEEEQFLLLYSRPVSKITYASRLGLSSEQCQTNLPNQPLFEAGTWQQPSLSSKNSFTSLLRQVEMESAMKARGTNPQLVIGRSDVGRRETTSDDLGVSARFEVDFLRASNCLDHSSSLLVNFS